MMQRRWKLSAAQRAFTTTKAALIQVWGREFPNPLRCAFLNNLPLTADTSRPGIARSQLGRSSAAYITNIAGKGARHEGQTA
jgi:hypothetical protein